MSPAPVTRTSPVVPRRALPPDGQASGSAATGARRWLVLATCCLSLFIVALDVSGLNVALPSIRDGLHVTEAHLQWILDSYTLVLATLLMLSGSLADRVGRKRVFMLGLVLFGLGSALCAFAANGTFLVSARMVQAVGGSMLNPVAMGIITNTFTAPRERAQAIGLWGATSGLAMALGPLVGGLLVEAFDWRAIFWLNLPVVVLALGLTWLVVPESKAQHPRSLDPAGQLLISVTLATLTYAIIEGRTAGWTSGPILGCLTVGAVALVGFAVVERRVPQPMVDLRFLSSIPFTAANLTAVLGFATLGGFLLVNTLYLQTARGLSPVQAGLTTLPMALASACCAPLSGRLTGTVGPRPPLMVSGLATAAAAVLLTRIALDTPHWQLLLTYALFGIGNGMLNAPISNTAVSGMPRSQAGVAASIASTSRQVGTALGVAVFGTILFSRMSGVASLPTASHAAWWLMAGLGVAICLTGFVVGLPAARRSRERVAELLGVED